MAARCAQPGPLVRGHAVRAGRRLGTAPHLQGGLRARLHGAGRTADSRPAQGRLPRRRGRRDRRQAAVAIVPAHLFGREKSTHRHRDRLEPRFGRLRGGNPGAAVLLRLQEAHGAARRCRRYDRTRRQAPEAQGHRPPVRCEPQHLARARPGQPVWWLRARALGPRGHPARGRYPDQLHGQPDGCRDAAADGGRHQGAPAQADLRRRYRGTARHRGRDQQAQRRLPVHDRRPQQGCP